jgi:5'-3' exonuclease
MKRRYLRLLSSLGFLPIAISATANAGGATCTEKTWVLWSSTTTSSPQLHCKYVSSLDKGREEEIREFVATNEIRLREDMSQGGGQALNDYATILGCPSDVIPAFSRMAQENFSKIFSDHPGPDDVLKNTRENMRQNRKLRNRCGNHLS